MKIVVACAAVAAVLAIGVAYPGPGDTTGCAASRRLQEARIYEAKIKALIEKIRAQLRAGVPEKNVPPMDPFVLDKFNLRINESFAQVDWNMTAGQIDGLLGFEVTLIKFNLAGLRFEYGFNFPQIAGKGQYGINGVLTDVLPVYGGGIFDVTAKGLAGSGKGKLGSHSGKLSLDEFSFLLELDSFKFNVTGLMNDEDLSKLLSKMISDSLPDLVERLQNQINSTVSPIVMETANKFLNNMTLQDLLDLLKHKPVLYRTQC